MQIYEFFRKKLCEIKNIVLCAHILIYYFRKEIDKVEKGKALREASKRVQLGPDSLPSICFYTLLNSGHTAISCDICDDSTLLAVGFNNSNIKVYIVYS